MQYPRQCGRCHLAQPFEVEGAHVRVETLGIFAAKRDHAAARYEYLLNSLRLKAAVGTLSEADLAVSNGWLEP